jgi:hypothetical protein
MINTNILKFCRQVFVPYSENQMKTPNKLSEELVDTCVKTEVVHRVPVTCKRLNICCVM